MPVYCQLPVCFFTVWEVSVVHDNSSEKQNWYYEWNSHTPKFTCLLTCIFFKYFNNGSENVHMIIVLFWVSVTFLPKAGTWLACLLEICLHALKCRQ